MLKLSPSVCSYHGRIFGAVETLQTLEASPSSSEGFTRKVWLRNGGDSPIRIRTICISDPAAAHFRDPYAGWGSLGVNAFNRESHVVLDEISEPHPARVVGSNPSPLKLYLTTDKLKATELLQAGELPEPTAGMSGQVIVLALHDLSLAPGESKEILFASLYSPSRLEDVLSSFGKLGASRPPAAKGDLQLSCSSPRVSEAFGWACASLEGARFEPDLLERMEVLRGLTYIKPDSMKETTEGLRGLVGKSGLVPHSLEPLKPGVLESSLMLSAASRFLTFAGDRRAARPHYPVLRKVGLALMGASRGDAIVLDPSLPQGWRRRIRSGYPSGEVPEVSLAVSSALLELSSLSRLLGKGEDAAKFRERAELIVDGVGKRLIDERGFLCLSVDPDGRMRSDETLDMAVSQFRNPSIRSVGSSTVHRLLEKDFETGFGPRTVPTTNRMYFNGAYGEGQLGGFWTRGALALACLSYGVGLPGIGGLALEKVSRLVLEESLKFGGAPGEFPYWVDLDGRDAHPGKSDPVAAARFVQTIVEGELGFSPNPPILRPPPLSNLRWVLARDIWTGEKTSIFVGRAAGRVFAMAACQKTSIDGGHRLSRCDPVEVSPRSIQGISFNGPGQTVCLGNTSQVPVRAQVSFAARSAGLARRLNTPLEEFEPKSCAWNKVGSLRVAPTMTFDASVPQGDWRVFRVSAD
jgi:hypothetical protein